jgi:hypothetical protein
VYAVKIPARGFDRADFATLASVEALLRRLGAS